MGASVTFKIIASHLLEGSLRDRQITLKVDQTLGHDLTGIMAAQVLQAVQADKVSTDSVIYCDHNVLATSPENADDHLFLKTAAQRFGIHFSKPGNGICHFLHCQRFASPGKVMLGADSHTPTSGALGMLAIGAGGIDVAVAMGGGPFYLTAPKVTLVRLTGSLRPGVSAKDVILHVLSIYGTKGNVGRVLEYGGPGLAALDVPARATITNMGAELGVTTSVFPSDAITQHFLAAQGRKKDWSELVADAGARYDQSLDLDLTDVEPMAACPHSPGNVATVASLADRKVNQVLIGSCTNSSYRDLKTVALLLRGRKIHPEVEVGVAPGSRQVVLMLAQEGLLTYLVAAGVRILENACGFCIGNHMSPGTNAVSLRTSNRNFEARSGTASAQVFLVSPETAAAAALTGIFTDPRTLGKMPSVAEPKQFTQDDSMFLFAATAGKGVPETAIVRGPNIGMLVITHYQRLLDYIVPDKVHVMSAGRIILSGEKDLALKLEAEGYDWVEKNDLKASESLLAV